MLSNLLIIAFLLLMFYWWGTIQGLFSSFLQLMVTIIAASLAFSLWEPIVVNFLLPQLGGLAWGVGLLVPFIIIFVVLRVALDKVVPGNLRVNQFTNGLAGGALGVLTGILVSGFLLVGIGFLPLSADTLGYQPLVVTDNGRIETNPSNQLWVPVDRHAADFFTKLSSGVFHPTGNTPIALYQADVATQSMLFRMRIDDNASVIATPKGVSVREFYSSSLGAQTFDPHIQKVLASSEATRGGRLIWIDTEWELSPGTFDADSVLRIAPSQIRLITWQDVDGNDIAQMHAPLAASKLELGETVRIFTPFNTDGASVRINNQKGKIGWAFVLPPDQTPKFIVVRHLRLELPDEIPVNPQQMAKALGKIPPELVVASNNNSSSGSVSPTAGHAGSKATEIVVSQFLPIEISMAMGGGLTFEGNAVFSGLADVGRSGMQISKQNRVESIYAPSNQRLVRVKVAKDEAQSIFGKALASAKMLQPIWIEDNRSGEKHYPIAYVWLKKADYTQRIFVDRTSPIRSAKELPIREMSGDDELFLYFALVPGWKVTAYCLGENNRQTANLDVPHEIPTR